MSIGAWRRSGSNFWTLWKRNEIPAGHTLLAVHGIIVAVYYFDSLEQRACYERGGVVGEAGRVQQS